MKNNGPVYNLTTGKINFPIDERVAIDPEGHIVGSWAIWTPPGDTPKSNTHDMAWLNKENLLDTLDTGFVFVGLNWSSTHGDQTKGGELAWSNFHSSYAYQHDYKLRYAVTDTRYWGSYMTDLIKFYYEVDSSKVKKLLRQNPDIITDNIASFEEEIGYLQNNPVLVAMGSDSYGMLQKHLGHKYALEQIRYDPVGATPDDIERMKEIRGLLGQALERAKAVRANTGKG